MDYLVVGAMFAPLVIGPLFGACLVFAGIKQVRKARNGTVGTAYIAMGASLLIASVVLVFWKGS